MNLSVDMKAKEAVANEAAKNSVGSPTAVAVTSEQHPSALVATAEANVVHPEERTSLSHEDEIGGNRSNSIFQVEPIAACDTEAANVERSNSASDAPGSVHDSNYLSAVIGRSLQPWSSLLPWSVIHSNTMSIATLQTNQKALHDLDKVLHLMPDLALDLNDKEENDLDEVAPMEGNRSWMNTNNEDNNDNNSTTEFVMKFEEKGYSEFHEYMSSEMWFFFVKTQEDINLGGNLYRQSAEDGLGEQVGLKCRLCNTGVSYPKTVEGIYKSINNFIHHHWKKCPEKENHQQIFQQYEILKEKEWGTKKVKKIKEIYSKKAKDMGLVNKEEEEKKFICFKSSK